METSNIEKVLTFLKGLGDRNPDLATKYVHPTKYKEHNPFATNSTNGLKEYISGFPSHNHHLKVIRCFQDDAYVFTQADGEILGRNTFFDVFKFEDDWIVEHWGFSEKSGPPNQSGHTQLDGPTKAKHHQDTGKNKALIRDYYETFHIAGDHSKIRQYFSDDVCIRHEPGVKDGVESFLHDVELAMKSRTIDEIDFLLGDGDFIFITANGTQEGKPCVYVDLYRVENKKNVEHWGFIENIPPREKLKNSNGAL